MELIKQRLLRWRLRWVLLPEQTKLWSFACMVFLLAWISLHVVGAFT